jgi:hypothetical protein
MIVPTDPDKGFSLFHSFSFSLKKDSYNTYACMVKTKN